MSEQVVRNRTSIGLSEAKFLNSDRIAAYAYAVVILYAITLIHVYRSGTWFLDSSGFPVATDFVNVWAAGFLAADGRAPEAYDWDLHKQAEIIAIGRPFDGYFGWHYPPMFLLIAMLLSWFSYLQAWFIWMALSGGFFLFSLRQILPRLAVPVGLAAPTSLACVVVGQNGFLTAGLMAAALAFLDRKPWLAGFFVGALTYKPQLGILFPIFLAMERRWKTFISASVTTIALLMISTIIFGLDIWRAFFESTALTNSLLLSGAAGWHKLQSVYSVIYQLVGDSSASLVAHFVVAACIGALAIYVWASPAPLAVKSAVLVTASFLVSPYAYVYDAVMLTVAAAFLAKDGLERGFGPWERILLCLACIVPAFFYVLNSVTSLISCCLLLFIALRRAAPRVAAVPVRPA